MRFQPVSVLTVAALALLAACGTREGANLRSGGANRVASRYHPPGPPEDPWGPYIREAAAKYDVPERWIREVIRVESGGRTMMGGTPITSGAGAMGLMQVMPATYAELRSRHDNLGPDAYDPHDNIMAGTAYIREMYEQYGSPGFLAAYNAGPRRLEGYLYGSRGLPRETRNYVAKIAPYIEGIHPRNRAAPEVYAAAALPANIPPGPRRSGGYMLARNSGRPASLALASTDRAPAPISYRMSDGPVRIAQLAPPVPTPSGPPALVSYRMSDGPAQSAQPVQVAQLEPSAPAQDSAPAPVSYRMSAGPIEVAELSPPPTAPAAQAARDETPASAARPANVPFGRGAVPVPEVASASRAPASSPFRLISTAQADTPAPAAATRIAATSGSWAVQVGAFASESQARGATGRARNGAQELSRARATVTTVQQGRNRLYRARLAGLSREAATAACERLNRARSTCVVLSPDAQG